jgi:hypothetical protein
MQKPYIPQPCHEDWNAMTQQEQGRFCDVCAKVVVDFTKMRDEEIINYLQQHSKQNTCGHFRNEQLLKYEKIKIDISTLPKNISFKGLMLFCFITFFSAVFFISCHSSKHVRGKVILNDTEKSIKKEKKELKKLLKTHTKGKVDKRKI